MAWFANVPHKELTVEKKKQNWVRFEGDRFVFPGGGTMFPRGANAYIDKIGKLINLKDGSIRTALDTGCGVSVTFPISAKMHVTIFNADCPGSLDELDRPCNFGLNSTIASMKIDREKRHIGISGPVSRSDGNLSLIGIPLRIRKGKVD